jgi:hypothetical protein
MNVGLEDDEIARDGETDMFVLNKIIRQDLQLSI